MENPIWLGKFFSFVELHLLQDMSLSLIYSGQRDGFKASDFHRMCDYRSLTLIVIKSQGEQSRVFGGFTTRPWKSTDKFESHFDEKAFLFSITDSEVYPTKDKAGAINNVCTHKDFGPIFGYASDLAIKDKCDESDKNISNFGVSYQIPLRI